jgi:hypothetical protein
VIGGVEAAGEPAVERLPRDIGDDGLGEPTAQALGLFLERNQDLLGERTGPRLDIEGALAEVEWDCRRFYLTRTLS